MADFTQEGRYIELKKQFDIYYQKTLLPLLKKNDEKRHKYMIMFYVLLLMALIFYPFIVLTLISSFSLTEEGVDVGWILGSSCIVIGLLCGPVYLYKVSAKKGIMKEFADFFGTFSYNYEYCIDDFVLQSSDLFKQYNSHKGDDYFHGEYKDVGITISEEKLQMITEEITHRNIYRNDMFNRVDVSRRKKVKKVFQGICILMDMNKKFTSRTVVLKDAGMFNIFNRVSGLERVELEDIKFEKFFEVYSNDQIEARYLLTSAFMERILKVRDLFGGKSIQLSFKDNQLLIVIPTKENMFEAHSFFRSNVNKKRIDKVFNQFYCVLSVVDILKLNQRLGF